MTAEQVSVVPVSAAPDEGLRVYLERLKPQLADVLPKYLTPERLVKLALVASAQNPDIGRCTKESIALSVMRVAQWGLEIGETAHLVPFRTKAGGMRCQAVADYRGLIQLARQAEICRDIEGYVVYQGDEFEYEYGTDMRLRHVPAPASRRGPITHAWIRIVRRYGSVSFHVMPIEDIEAIRRQYSRQWSPDKVKDCPPWYAIKTCIRDYLARQPKMSERLQDALNDEEAEKEEVDDAVS